ncbi:unnamed protein product [Eruca vesicaria subsp. sativa]|uniref:RING-CH-type domain-containing protein n=1 Tax=Eruca vesicaria subsp. sativa TaxID=29727 RepID=A0ABC8L6Y9_ERUVS|nr:unnamed protein product [Eruca vesicaria subsp. sativa]
MDIFPADIEDGGYGQALPTEESDKDDDGGDLCRICRSPEGPDDPLRYPCACRGSIKYVHQECLRLWLNRRGNKQCEICRRSYSFVPVYSENAPERLPWHEFLRGLSRRSLRVAAYVFVSLFNAFCFSLHPWGRRMAIENQRVFQVSEMFAFLLAGSFYNAMIAYLWIMMVVLRPLLKDILRLLREIYGGILVVFAISFWVSFFFVLLPLVMGRLVVGLLLLIQRTGVATQLLSGDPLAQEPVFLGYLTMLSLSLAYLGRSFATLSRDTVQAIAKRLSTGFIRIAMTLPYFIWIRSAKMWKNLYMVNDGLVLCLKFGAFPMVLGCWFDFCTLPVLGTTVSERLEFFSEFPLVVMLHWSFGLLCLQGVFISMELIQKILQKRPFWFLLDVTDPTYKTTKLHLGQYLFALAFNGSLVVILVHLPILTITFISPSFFPIQLWFYDESFKLLPMVAYIAFARSGPMEWLVKIIQPAIEPIVHKWILTVSSWLQLSDFFLETHANQNVRPLFQPELEARGSWSHVYSIGEGSLVRFYGSQNDTTCEDDTDEDSCRFILLRIGLMLVLAALSLCLISTISMALPILVGRTFFHCISFIMIKFGIIKDDVYGFWIGCYILRKIYIGTSFILNHIRIRRTDLLLNLALLWMRNALLFSIWVSFIPTLLGLLIDLMIIIPLQVPLSQPPVYSLLRDWLIGLVLLHIWTYLTMFTRVNCFATAAWREKLKRIRSVGINRLPVKWLLGKVICPIINTLLTTLALPFLVAHSLFPLLQFSGAVNLAVQRLIWPVLLAIIILGFAAKLTLKLIHYIHSLEYDDRYMVGDRVADFV